MVIGFILTSHWREWLRRFGFTTQAQWILWNVSHLMIHRSITLKRFRSYWLLGKAVH